MKYQCRDDETNPYNPNDEEWTPTNLQLRYAVEELMMTVAFCVRKITDLTGEELPTDGDTFREFMESTNTDKIVH
jgi:hypothetical protein